MSTVTLENKTILVTGAAGFIGSNLVKRIYQEAPSATVIGIDNMNAYYDVALKEFRLNELAKYPTFTFVKGNIADKALITELFEKYNSKSAKLNSIELEKNSMQHWKRHTKSWKCSLTIRKHLVIEIIRK